MGGVIISKLTLKNVYYVYPSEIPGLHTVALKGISTVFKSGELVLLLGPTGSGKSTLLNIIRNFIPMTSGMVLYNNQSDIAPKIGYVDQFSYQLLEFNNTVAEFLELSGQGRDRINQVLEDFQLLMIKDEKVCTLSFGESQRVIIALVCLHDPDIFLFDEPTAQLDSDNTQIIMKWIANKKRDKIIIIATHDIRLIGFGDKVIKLSHGFLEGILRDTDNNSISYRIPSLQEGGMKLPEDIWHKLNAPKEVELLYDANSRKIEITGTSEESYEEEYDFNLDFLSQLKSIPQLKVVDTTITTPFKRQLGVPDKITANGGQIVGLVGPSGTGKSSYLLHVNGLLPSSFNVTGSVEIETTENMAFIQQDNRYLNEFTLQELMDLILDKQRIKIFRAYMLHFDIPVYPHRKFTTYSGGQRYLLIFGLVLVKDPAIIFMDETLANLDKKKKSRMIELLRDLKDKNRLILLSTHDAEVEEIFTNVFYFTKNGSLKKKMQKEGSER